MTKRAFEDQKSVLNLIDKVDGISSLVRCAWLAAGNLGHTDRETADALQETLTVASERLENLSGELEKHRHAD